MRFHSASGLCLSLLLLTVTSLPLCAQEADLELVRPKAPNLSELIRFVVIESSKEGFSSEKYWNKTSERFDGLKIKGLKISKRKKRVKHGFCRKYSAILNQPEKTFTLTIDETTIPDEQVLAYRITATLKARCEATFAHYVYGVKGINGTTVADADLKINILISLDPQTRFSLSEPIPKIYLNAQVRNVDLWLTDIDVRKIGVLDGKFAEVLGDGAEEAIEELVQNQESRVKKQLQKELDDIQGQPLQQK